MPADLDSGATILLGVEFGGLRIAPDGLTVESGVTHPTIELTGSMLTPTANNHTYKKSGDRTDQNKEIGEAFVWELKVFTCGPDSRVEYKLLNDALRLDPDGNFIGKQGVLMVEGSQDLAPSPTNTVLGFQIPGNRLGPIGGNVGDPKEYTYTTPVSGAIEELTTVIAQPTTLVALETGPTTIDLTWDADSELLVNHQGIFRVKHYDIFQSLTTSVGFVKVNTAPVLANQNGNTFTATGLTTVTQYFFYVVARGIFGDGDSSPISAEAEDTTS